MALVLDTTTIAPRERAEAVRAAMRYARVPALLTHETEERVHARLDVWELGGTATLLHRTSSGLVLRRTPRQVRECAEDRIGLVVLSPGRWSFGQHGERRHEQTARWEALVVDHAAAYDFGRYGDGSTYAVNLDHAALGLPRELIHAASGRLPSSPLYRLLVDHVRGVARDIDAVLPGAAGQMLGAATLELVRALVAGAADSRHPRPDDDAGALLAQTKIYVRRHFADPGLSPLRIARAHAVSVRRLYAVWAADPQSLAGHIMAVRLEAARSRLAAPSPRPPTIASVGHACGFADMAHFARRFRQAYGMTPREWRRDARDAPSRIPAAQLA
ncbi:helix-turn-helix domain-containing protein [Actinoplanes sp. RD1]|uniref:helix-turn-helix domain-containing protein n=1 Tax=Actinoplanes sp. RD1 TaxID=3064538 RepID=UPI002741E707|nr:helix-turn-helix domain-containing protein [Actinoplanes sp. RD1]